VKRLSDQTLYEILEVPVDAPPEEIERAYARAVVLYGPDSLATYSLVSTDEARRLNNRSEEAHAVLLDPVARAGYDERIGVRAPSSAGAPMPAPPPTTAPAPIASIATPAPIAPATTPWPPPAPVKVAPPVLLEPPSPALGAPPAAVEPEVAAPAVQVPLLLQPLPAPAAAPVAAPPPAAEASPAEPVPAAAPVAAPIPAAPAPSPILLNRELAGQREVVIPEGAAWTGEMLRQVREARGISTVVLSERTKVIRYHIENIEADRFEALPVGVYLRGILMSLARELRLDGQKVARSYLDRMAAEVGPPPRK
jgi:hypothetical protein